MALNKEKTILTAQKYLQKGNIDKALAEYYKIIKEDPREIKVRQWIGDLLARKGDSELAIKELLIVAEGYTREGFYTKAVAVYKQILRINPNLMEVNLYLGDLYQNLSLYSDSIAHYRKIADYYEKKGMIREAISVYEKMLELEKGNVDFKLKLADYYSSAGFTREAINLYHEIADYFREKNLIENLIKVLEKLTVLNSHDYKLIKRLASLYLNRKEPKKALQKLQIPFKHDPKDPETLELLAEAFLQIDQLSKAHSVFTQLRGIYQSRGLTDLLHEVNQKIHYIEGRLGPRSNLEKARHREPEPSKEMTPPEEKYATFKEDIPEGIQRILTEVSVYKRYGLVEKALEQLKLVIARSPDTFTAYRMMKDIYREMGKTKDTIATLMKMHEIALRRDNLSVAKSCIEEAYKLNPADVYLKDRLKGLSMMTQDEEGEIPRVESEDTETTDYVENEGEPLDIFEEEEVASKVEGLGEITAQEEGLSTAMENEEYAGDEEDEKRPDEKILTIIEDEEDENPENAMEEASQNLMAELLDEIKEEELKVQKDEWEDRTLPPIFDKRVEKERSMDNKGELEIFDNIEKELDLSLSQSLEREDTGGGSQETREGHFELGSEFFDSGLYENALYEFKQALKNEEREKDEILFMIGKSNFNLHEYEKAIRAFNETIKQNKMYEENLDLLLSLAISLYRVGKKTKALEIFKKISRLDPSYGNGEVQKFIKKIEEDTEPF